MLSTFSGIEMGKRALNAFRLGMQTVGHNISNMETEGYSRQVVNYGTVQPMDLPGMGQVGQGVQVEEITRIRDEFLDFQYRSNQANLGYWDKINSLYETIQNYIAEPAGEGVRVAMSTFFDAMQSVQQTPEDAAARRNLVESAQSLGTVLDSLVNGFETYTKAVNQEVLTSVQDANKMLHEIAALNKQIYHAEALDQNANDLLDQRDLLLDKLSSMMDITYNEPMGTNPTGEFFLTLNGRALIQGDHVRELVAHAFQWDGQVYYDVQVSENEFDIVDNCYVADVLTTGPDGVHQLNVDRIANGEEWTVGGGDAHCMEASSVTTAEFASGVLLTADSEDIPRKLAFRVLKSDNTPVNLVVKIDKNTDNTWKLRAEVDGTETYKVDASSSTDLTAEELKEFINIAVQSNAGLLDSDVSFTTSSPVTIEGATEVSFKIADEETPLTFDNGMVLYEQNKDRTVNLTGKDSSNKDATFEVITTWNTSTEKWDVEINVTVDGTSSSIDASSLASNELTVDALTDFLASEGYTDLAFTTDSVLDNLGQGTIRNAPDTDARELSFKAKKDDKDAVVDIKMEWGGSAWNITGTITVTEDDGTETTSDFFADDSRDSMTVPELTALLNGALTTNSVTDADGNSVTASFNASMTSAADEGKPIEVTDYSGMLGALSSVLYENTKVDMRTRPMSVDEALGITGSFRIQVGTQGTRVFSNNFRENAALELGVGEIIGAPKDGEDTKHTFRIGVSDQQIDITASWNGSTQRWELSSDALVAGVNVPSGMTYPAVSTGGTGANAGKVLTVADLTNFINQAASVVPDAKLNAVFSTNTEKTSQAFYIDSTNAHLISISDVEGNLAERMGIANPNPVITIDVAESDSLTIIRNKINEKYQEAFGITEPEQWVHASIQQDSDHSYYLTIAADVAGEAQRITLMGEEGGSMQVLRRLGLTANVSVGSTEDGTKVYREVAAIATKAQDASFTFDNVRYLSSDNMFSTARRIPASDSKTDYSASKMVEVSEGMWFNIKHEGIATITSRHHIKNGSIKALEEARDEVIPNLKGTLDEVAYSLVKNLNAYQYSGYGIGSDITMTGVAFFDPLSTKAGAARALSVNDAVVYDNALIGAAMGRKNAAGLAVSGVSGGSGDGSNAGRMNGLSSARILKDGTVSLGGEYDAMLAEIGADAGHAKFMYTAQSNVSEQIDQQRKAVSGVNLDEELMSIVMLNRSFGAMSRYITTIDEMLNTIINGMGLVGR